MGDKVAAHGDRRVEELRRRSEDACRRVLILIHLSEDTEEEEDGERIISFVMAWICVGMWMECVAMCVDGCVERVCPRELCGVRFEVRGVHASGLSSMCPSVYAMLWSVVLWAWFLPLYGGARVGRLYLVWKV